ncbi:MAG: HAMP domain-containing histidine kinase [Elusimicrobiales bacterium]|nr:HAMP domain-containing histidine kinase [Elusimicrobiales bacterium]
MFKTAVKLVKALDRGEVTNFSRNSYEVVFSIFMVALAYFYRNSPQIEYPRILYFFLLLLGTNFVFNYLLRSRDSVNLWLIDLILLANYWIITGVVYYSGGGSSYFWTLYLLPVFAASLMASFKDAFGVVFLCVLAIGVMSWPLGGGELAGVLGFAIKVAVLSFSAGVVYSTAQSKKRAEAGLAFKRQQVGQLEKAIEQKETELVQSASAGEVGTLAAGVLHDLGNAVSVILLTAQISVEDEKPEKKDLERILKAARFAKGVISNAFAIVRGKEFVFEQAALGEPAETAVMLTEYAARKRNVQVKLQIPADLPALRISKVHVERLFINTISNALSFVPEGGWVRVSAAAVEGGVQAEIADNGPGFPEQMLNDGVKAFGTTRKETGGTGLGLYVSSQIARSHGGWLRLENAPAGGALIKVFFPYTGP